MLDESRFEQLINPSIPIPQESTRIHGIADTDVEGAPRFADFADKLRTHLEGRVVVGHHIAFDLAVLRYEAERAHVPWQDPPSLDVGMLLGALEPRIDSPDLETVARLLGVTIRRRHHALDDALAAAEAYLRLLPRLREADIRTLGEAQTLAARRAVSLPEQIDGATNAPARPRTISQPVESARIDSYVFERRLHEVMSTPAVAVPSGTKLRQAARLMVERRIGAVLVGADNEPPLGILTERDLLRATADATVDPDEVPVEKMMSSPVETISGDEMLYRALGRMDRKGIRHLCVADDVGLALGLVSQRDLLRHRARASLALGDAIAMAIDEATLAAAYSNLPVVASSLLAEKVAAIDIARVISSEVRALTAAAARIAAGRLTAQRGSPPAPWCLLVLGSGGRAESLLAADQDNALVHSGDPAHGEWFTAFGATIADVLDEAGLPRCRGGVMAANKTWSGNELEWRERISGWLARANPQDLLHVDIFFDLVPVAGDAGLARSLHEEAVQAASRNPTFIALLAESVVSLPSPVSWFGRLATREGRLDLKSAALLPIVSIARTLALRIGSPARSTPDRLREAVTAGRLPSADAELLVALHAKAIELMLRQQLQDLSTGIRPSGRIAVNLLDRREMRQLARELAQMREILDLLQRTVSG